VGKSVVITVVRCGSQQHRVVGQRGEVFRQLISLCFLYLIGAAGRTLCVRAALVRFVDDDKVPPLIPNPLAHRILLGIVQRSDHLRSTLPRVAAGRHQPL
jgi:hypothetical protein